MEKASPSFVFPACFQLLLLYRGAEDLLPAGKVGPSMLFFLSMPSLDEKKNVIRAACHCRERVLGAAKLKANHIHPGLQSSKPATSTRAGIRAEGESLLSCWSMG